MKINQVLVEAQGATVAFAFGRFNPAHQGHIEVWRTVEEAGKNWFVGTNPNTIGPNDPLTFQQKSAWMEEIYPPISGHIVPQTTVLSLAAYIFKKLRNNESASIAYVTDDTDWAWSGKLLNQYNGVEGAHGYYKFAEITHVPSPRVSSATALRDAARADDKVAFYHASGTDPKLKVNGLSYFDTVKEACEKYPLPVKRAKNIADIRKNKVSEAELSESTSLQTTIKAIINDTGEPVTATYETLKFLAKKYIKDNGELDRGWRMVAMGPGASWVERFYATKLKNELYDLLVYNKKDTADLRDFLWGEYKDDDQLEMKRSFSNISQALPPILAELGVKLNAPQMTKNANRWMQNLKQYQELLTQLQRDSVIDTTQSNNSPVIPKSTLPGQQNAQVEKIVNDILSKLPKNVSGEIRNIVARSSNKLQTLQKELTDRNLSVKENEQKTVAKTWDQMTPQEKISGVKGRTVWNEKTQRYYTVFDVPVKQVKEDEEAGEVKKTGQLIPFPAGTTKVHVSDVYDWYKLGMMISDLDDADPKTFGQGAPQTIIAFGSEEEESKLLPLLQRLGLRVDDIDPEGTDEIGEAYHAGSLYDNLINKRK